MSREQASYFIHDWQEIGDQVRQMINSDARFKVIQARRVGVPIASRTMVSIDFFTVPRTDSGSVMLNHES